MATITLNLKAKMTKAEQHAANKLMAAAICQDADGIELGLKDPIVLRLRKRGALKLDSRICSDD